MARIRLDQLVASKIDVSRSFATKLIQSGKVKVGKKINDKPSQKLSEEEKIEVNFDKNTKKVQIKIPVIYEDEQCIVINKPTGILTHSKGAYNPEPTVASWLGTRSNFSEPNERSGIVHRLDRATSGVMILAKNESSQKHFQKQFAKRNVKKIYNAVTSKKPNPIAAVIDVPIARSKSDPKKFVTSVYGKPSQTIFKLKKVLKIESSEFFLVELSPKTGRTHQIRVHLKYLNAPIIGDDFYGGLPADRLYLHATSLEVTMPDSSRKVFKVPLPKNFLKPKIIK